jgi:hypothetical protein
MIKSRFHACNFSGSIVLLLNKEMAVELHDFIREREQEVEVSTAVHMVMEQIDKQFYFMHDLLERHRAGYDPTEGITTENFDAALERGHAVEEAAV